MAQFFALHIIWLISPQPCKNRTYLARIATTSSTLSHDASVDSRGSDSTVISRSQSRRDTGQRPFDDHAYKQVGRRLFLPHTSTSFNSTIPGHRCRTGASIPPGSWKHSPLGHNHTLKVAGDELPSIPKFEGGSWRSFPARFRGGGSRWSPVNSKGGGVVEGVFRPDFEGGGSRWSPVNSRGGSWRSFPARFRGGVVDEVPWIRRG